MKTKSCQNKSLCTICVEILICLALAIATFAVYRQMTNHEFIHYDDHFYVTENRHINEGLSLESVVWAFTTTHGSNWHPLTWLSHMLDVILYGLNAGGHHLTSLLFHIANTLLLFFILKRMTGSLWKSGFVAALFALHPLHVESVAWASERKDVLSTFFWLLTMGAYCHYAALPGFGRYFFVLLFFVCGLMSKPMLVTLPFVLLLMDYWPLGRLSLEGTNKEGEFKFRQATAFRLVWEKIPLFVLTASACVATFMIEAVTSLDLYPLDARIANALVSYIRYIGRMFWPGKLAFFYPYPVVLPKWQVAAALLLLTCAFYLAIRNISRRPYITVGWLWYIGTLVPVIGLVQIGAQAMADRYTYLPLIGLFIIIAWGVPDFLFRWRHKNIWLAVSATVLLAGLTATTWKQISYWKDSTVLFEHALKVTSDNYKAHNNLGVVLRNQGKIDQAVIHYLKAIRIKPNYAEVHNNLGFTLYKQGNTAKAIDCYLEALRIKPDYVAAHNNVGIALEKEGRIEEAISHFLKALSIQPDTGTYLNLGFALFRKGDTQGAIKQYLAALHQDPACVEAYYNLGIALEKEGRIEEAVNAYLKALSINPDFAGAHNNIGILLEKKGCVDEAIGHYFEALRIKPLFQEVHNNLGVAFYLKGNIKRAIYHFQEALRIKPNYIDAKNNLDTALAAGKQG